MIATLLIILVSMLAGAFVLAFALFVWANQPEKPVECQPLRAEPGTPLEYTTTGELIAAMTREFEERGRSFIVLVEDDRSHGVHIDWDGDLKKATHMLSAFRALANGEGVE
jgi:hypothetical protein